MQTNMKGLAPEWYRLIEEADADDPVEFYIAPLDGFQWSEVLGASYDPETGSVGASGLIKAFKLAVRGWRGIEDAETGERLAFSRRAMRTLRPGWVLEVGKRVLEISNMAAEEKKASDSPS